MSESIKEKDNKKSDYRADIHFLLDMEYPDLANMQQWNWTPEIQPIIEQYIKDQEALFAAWKNVWLNFLEDNMREGAKT